MANIIQQIKEIVKACVGNEYFYFNAVAELSFSNSQLPARAWGACVSPDDTLYLMDAEMQWYPVEEKYLYLMTPILNKVEQEKSRYIQTPQQ